MKIEDIIRAWKDPEFRATQKDLPQSPAGLVELDDVALESVMGAYEELERGLTNYTEGCTVSGDQWSCGYVCTATGECFC
jgi:mersacidin/lichenicidin family type 2 lantibiotic